MSSNNDDELPKFNSEFNRLNELYSEGENEFKHLV